MKKILLGIVFFCSFFTLSGFGFDWVRIHKEAAGMNSQDAEYRINQKKASIEELYLLALVYLHEHKDEKAEGVFRILLGLAPDLAPAQWGVAECLRRKHQYDKAIPMLSGVIEQDEEFVPAYISLGYIRYMQMEFNETVRLMKEVLVLEENKMNDTNLANAHGLYAGAKGMIAHYGGPFSKAVNGAAILPHLKKAEQAKPESASVLYGFGSYYLLIPPVLGRDVDKAIEYLQRAIEKDPLFPDAYVRLAQAYRAKGSITQYQEYLDKALSIDPQNEIALDIQSGRCKFVCF